ncbi:MAG: hypothetical protein FWE02_01935 [Defluviitaleaceae bacterium]|nr:hypothetical protein [Defluviitaleaceae bacterium]
MNTLEILYDEIKSMIDSFTGENGKQFTCGQFEGLGWLDFYYKTTTYEGYYPRISLKIRSKAVHFYIMLWKDGKPILEDYIEVFGKSSVGKGCLRIKKLNDEKRLALKEIILEAIVFSEKN